MVQLKKETLVVGHKGFDAKTKWLSVNRQSWSNSDFDFVSRRQWEV
jgi:hypothetical protein